MSGWRSIGEQRRYRGPVGPRARLLLLEESWKEKGYGGWGLPPHCLASGLCRVTTAHTLPPHLASRAAVVVQQQRSSQDLAACRRHRNVSFSRAGATSSGHMAMLTRDGPESLPGPCSQQQTLNSVDAAGAFWTQLGVSTSREGRAHPASL